MYLNPSLTDNHLLGPAQIFKPTGERECQSIDKYLN